MTRIDQTLDLAIKSTAEYFLQNPANYSDERALAEDVRSRLNGLLQPASVSAVMVEESSEAQGSVPDHEAYTAHYRDTNEIDRAQCEVGGSEFPFGHRERLDLGIFSDQTEIRIIGGTQEFNPDDLAAAVEFKYIKNINYLRYRPTDDNSKYQDIVEDIERLGELPDHVDLRCIIFANYDLFRRNSDIKAEQELQDLASQCGVKLQFILPSPKQDN